MDNPRILSLCTGCGGIELGLRQAIGACSTVAYVEIEAYAIAAILKAASEKRMDAAPLWTDLKSFDGRPFRGKVDILTGGYPCQPFSAAGKRLGDKDSRHLWPHIRGIIESVRPVWCFFENVEGHITMGLEDVLRDLEGLGFDATWGIFSAEECGAPHRRKRVFILANRIGTGLEGHTGDGHDQTGQAGAGAARSIGESSLQHPGIRFAADCIECPDCEEPFCEIHGQHYADCRCLGPHSEYESTWPARPGEQQYDWEEPRVVADAASAIDNGIRAKQGGPPDGLADEGAGQAQSGMGGTANGTAHRVDRLRLLGNGVVPATAAKAWTVLRSRFDG